MIFKVSGNLDYSPYSSRNIAPILWPTKLSILCNISVCTFIYDKQTFYWPLANIFNGLVYFSQRKLFDILTKQNSLDNILSR